MKIQPEVIRATKSSSDLEVARAVVSFPHNSFLAFLEKCGKAKKIQYFTNGMLVVLDLIRVI